MNSACWLFAHSATRAPPVPSGYSQKLSHIARDTITRTREKFAHRRSQPHEPGKLEMPCHGPRSKGPGLVSCYPPLPGVTSREQVGGTQEPWLRRTPSHACEREVKGSPNFVTRAAPKQSGGHLTDNYHDDEVHYLHKLIAMAIPPPPAALGLWLARLEGRAHGDRRGCVRNPVRRATRCRPRC